MGQHKQKLAAVKTAIAFSLPDVPMPPDQQFILDGLVQAAMGARAELQMAERRCNAYIVECAAKLGVNSPQYKWDPEKRIFQKNPEYKAEEKPA